MFRMQGAFLVNDKGKVMDVSGNSDTENRNIIMYKKHGGLNQQWDLIYADQYPKEPVKGEFSKDFGLYVERPFYIISQMKENRFLDLVGRDFVIKTRNSRPTQTWWFDQKTWTIRNKGYSNQAFDIKSSGKTTNMQVWSVNSGWW